MRNLSRRWLSLWLVLALCVAGVFASGGGTASAAKVPFTAWGTVSCTMSGTRTIKPGLGFTAQAGIVVGFKAKLTCTTGTTGNSTVTVKTGRINALSAPSALSCSGSALPATTATVKWSAKGGKVNPTYIIWNAGTNTTSPRVAATYPVSTAVAGSYAQGPARAYMVNDVMGQAACSSATGMKNFKFTGVGGASTFSIVNSPGIELFRDDFNGSSLDLSKWQPNWVGKNDAAITKPVNTAEQGCYDPAQVSEGGGTLHLTAVARSCAANNGITYPYASGIVQSKNHFTFTYGYMEARIWMPPGSGAIRNWPAFWADGTGTHPLTGEIDVVEGLAGKACWHFHFSGGEPGGCVNAPSPAGWHTYGADWRPGVVTYYYDGVKVGQITQGITSSPMFVILNLGVSSTVSGPVSVPSEMQVDYVRVTP